MTICQEIRMVIERTDPEAEAPILWSPDAKRWLIRKDPDAWEGWKQDVKQTTEDEIVGCITNSMGMSLSKPREMVKDREDWHAAVRGASKSHMYLSDWTTARTRMVKVHGFPPICNTNILRVIWRIFVESFKKNVRNLPGVLQLEKNIPNVHLIELQKSHICMTRNCSPCLSGDGYLSSSWISKPR